MPLHSIRWAVWSTFICYMPGCAWSGATHAEWSAHLATHY